MNISLSQKALLLCTLTLVVSGVSLIRFSTHAPVLALTLAFVVITFSLVFKMLYAAMKEIQSIARIASDISNGTYTIITPISGEETMSPMIETFNALAQRLKQHDLHLRHKSYQATVLKEISERVTTSLDENEAMEIIAGSLGRVVPYNIVSHLTLNSDGTTSLTCHMEGSVSKAFAEETKRIAFRALTAVSGATITDEQIKKTICFGAFFDDNTQNPVRSFFTLPVYVSGVLVGAITVTSSTPNLYQEEEIGVLYAVTEQTGAMLSKIKTLITEESNKIHSMLSSINEGLIMATTSQTIAIINEKAKQIIGIPHRDHPSLLDVIQALYGIFDFRGAIDRVLSSKHTELFQEFTAESNTYKITANPVKEKGGNIVGVVFVFSDVTKEKEIDRMKTEFISITSHQLRTPLSSMKWFLEMLLNNDAGEMPEKQRGIVTDVYNSNERIITLVNDLLDVSRIEAGKMQNEPTPTNLIEFLKSMLPEAELQFKKRKQLFEFHRPDTLPRVMIDPKLAWQVIQNLLSNASKYTPEGGKISLELSLQSDAILLTVADNGYGIPEFQQHRIFEKFFRADNTAKMEGTGLGMHIARQITEAIGGKIWFESSEGKGTTFYLSLPLTGDIQKQKSSVHAPDENDTMPII
ncbi:MAG: ATP-binding protein [Candidatus Azambacteria bacterium]|nr:ATP-binding protein [Candidatus Azambacteria bacterium]